MKIIRMDNKFYMMFEIERKDIDELRNSIEGWFIFEFDKQKKKT